MQFNFSEYDRRVTLAEVMEYLRTRPGEKALSISIFAIGSLAVIGVVFGFLTGDGIGSTAIVGAFTGLFSSAFLVMLYTKYAETIKLKRIAESNGLGFVDYNVAPIKPGMIFNVGSSRKALDILVSQDKSNDFEIGKCQYTVKNGRNRQTIQWSYLSIKLERALPHMLLDSKKNNLNLFGLNISNMPESYKNVQKLQLEGDFSDRFDLFVPEGYERDALYFFTPDLMALLIDGSGEVDAEIVDDRLYFYAMPSLSIPNAHRRFLELSAKLLTYIAPKIEKSATRYEDERASSITSNVIAPAGKRLKKGYSAAAVVAGAVGVIWVIVQLIYTLTRFGR